jgi:hypothetical protein
VQSEARNQERNNEIHQEWSSYDMRCLPQLQNQDLQIYAWRDKEEGQQEEEEYPKKALDINA